MKRETFYYTLCMLIPLARTFAPQRQTFLPFSSDHFMSDENTSNLPEKVICIGAAPMIGGTVFFGENYWDKLTMEIGSRDTGVFLRAAEVKHGRIAMLATVGYALQKWGITFDKFSPHEYLSIRQGVKFADLAAMGPIEAIRAVPREGLLQIFFAVALIEIYELTHKDGEFQWGFPGLQSGGLTGDLEFNPLRITITERRLISEIQNGRAAMFAIMAWLAAETVPGSVPLPLPW